MAALTFRNRFGDLVTIPAVAAGEARHRFGALLDHATSTGPVAITRRYTTRAVLMSVEEFESLASGRQSSLAALDPELGDLLAKMQSPQARKGIAAAFTYTPAELGEASRKAVGRK